MSQIYEIEYKGNFRAKGKMTKLELLVELRGNFMSFEDWCGAILVEFGETIADLEEELRNEKDNNRV